MAHVSPQGETGGPRRAAHERRACGGGRARRRVNAVPGESSSITGISEPSPPLCQRVIFFSLALTRSSSLLPPLVVAGAYITDAWSGGQRFAAFVTFSWVSSIRSLGEADLECINGKGE